MDLCSSATDAQQSWLRTVSNTHQKLQTWCPENQLTAGQSSVWQVLEQPGLLNFENLRGWRFHSPSATLFGSLLGSSTITEISFFLTTSMNSSCCSWLLLLALFLHLYGRSLASSPLQPTHRGGWKTSIQFPSVLSSLLQVDQEQSSLCPLPGCHTLKGSTQQLSPSCSLHQSW